MRCDEAREFVMPVYDGETVPPEAATHIARCAKCQESFKQYAEMGVALRSYGSLFLAEPIPAGTWPTTERNTATWWRRGFQMMPVPRIAFASLLLSLVVLGSGLALVEVGAHSAGPVLLLKLTTVHGDIVPCDVSISDRTHNSCGGLSQLDNANLFYGVRVLKKDGSRVLLSIRSRVTPMEPASYGPDVAGSLPETQSWFTPGDTLSIPDTGELKLTLTGEWADHMPITPGSNKSLDPGPGEIRLTSPLLLKNGKVAGDMANMTADADRPDEGVDFYVPGEGRFVLSPIPVAGAVPAAVQLNRVSFESDGQKYVVVTGMPVSREEKLWALHNALYKPASGEEQGATIGAGPVRRLLR